MGKGGSSSSSSTTTANYDQRVAAEGEGLALGSGAAIISIDEFPDSVAKGFQQLIDFAAGALDTIKDNQEKSAAFGEKALDSAAESSQGALAAINSSNEQALNALLSIGEGAADIVKSALEAVKTTGEAALAKVAENQEANNPESTSIYKELFPWVAIAAVVLIAIWIFGKGK